MLHRGIALLFALICFVTVSTAQSDKTCTRDTDGPFYDCENAYTQCPTPNINATCMCFNTLLNCFEKIGCSSEPIVATYAGTCRENRCPADMCEPKKVLTSGSQDLQLQVEHVIPLLALTVLSVLSFVNI